MKTLLTISAAMIAVKMNVPEAAGVILTASLVLGYLASLRKT